MRRCRFKGVDADAQIDTRDFAPAVGIAEDPVTGSANGALAGYPVREGIQEDAPLNQVCGCAKRQ